MRRLCVLYNATFQLAEGEIPMNLSLKKLQIREALGAAFFT